MPAPAAILPPEDLVTGGDLRLLARTEVDGFLSGLHHSPHRGTSAQFKQHRPYVPGDDLRMLDWKIYGKSDKFFVREFEDETNLRATLLLDTSRSMAYGGRRSKHGHAVRLAASLAHLLLGQQDAVGLATFDDRLRAYHPNRATPRHLATLTDALAGSTPSTDAATTDFANVFTGLLPHLDRHARRGLVILLTDAFGDADELGRGLLQLRHARHDVLLLQVLHRDELDFPFRGGVRFDGLEAGGSSRDIDATLLRTRYLKRVEAFRQAVAVACGEAGVDHLEVVTDEPIADTLRRFLRRRQSRAGRGRRR